MPKEMYFKSLATGLVISMFFVLTGCSHHVTNDITSRMILEDIYIDYKVQPKNLSADSKCNTPPTVKIINTDNRSEEVFASKIGVHSYYVRPREIMDSATSYLKTGYEKSGIKSDNKSSKTIEIKLVSSEMSQGLWQFGGNFKIEVNIPDKKLSKVYEATEYGQILFTVLADSIHLITRQIIEDKSIQDYILCKI